MRLLACTLATAAMVASPLGAALHAQSKPATLDISKVAISRDSFVVMMQGQEMGYQVVSTEKTPEGIRVLADLNVMGGMQVKKDEVLVGSDNAVRSVKSDVTVQGQTFNSALSFQNGRVTGKVALPGQEKTVDAAFPAGTTDGSMLLTMLPTLPFADGAKFSIPLFSAMKGDTVSAEVEVKGSESVTVPAGTFDAWAVSVSGAGNGTTIYVAKATPRIVKISPANAPIEMQLAK